MNKFTYIFDTLHIYEIYCNNVATGLKKLMTGTMPDDKDIIISQV